MEHLWYLIITLWQTLGSPSYISGALLAALWKLWRYTRFKIRELESLHGEIKILEEKLAAQKELFTTRINDMKK